MCPRAPARGVGARPGVLERSVRYLLHRSGCASPFRISRMLVLAAWRGLPVLEEAHVEGEPYGFSMPEVAEVVEAMARSGCAERDEARRCVRYLCPLPEISRDEREVLDEVYAIAEGLGDVELNRLVIRDPRYRELIGARGGP